MASAHTTGGVQTLIIWRKLWHISKRHQKSFDSLTLHALQWTHAKLLSK